MSMWTVWSRALAIPGLWARQWEVCCGDECMLAPTFSPGRGRAPPVCLYITNGNDCMCYKHQGTCFAQFIQNQRYQWLKEKYEYLQITERIQLFTSNTFLWDIFAQTGRHLSLIVVLLFSSKTNKNHHNGEHLVNNSQVQTAVLVLTACPSLPTRLL